MNRKPGNRLDEEQMDVNSISNRCLSVSFALIGILIIPAVLRGEDGSAEPEITPDSSLIQPADEAERQGLNHFNEPEGLPLLDESSTLDDYLEYAALNNSGLKASFHRWQAVLAGVEQSGAFPDPRISYSYFIREVETRVGPQRQKFGVAQTFPWFGERGLRREAAAGRADTEYQHFETAMVELVYRVKQAYYQFAFLGRVIAITEENMRLLTALEGVARSSYTVGTTSHADVIRAQVELGVLEERLLSLRDQAAPIRARINALLNRETDALLPWPATVSGPGENRSSTAIDSPELLKTLAARNPELRALESAVAGESAAVQLARKRRYPDFTFSVEYVDTGEALAEGTPDSGKDPLMAMVSLNIPVWRDRYRAAEAEAQQRVLALEMERRERLNHLAADLELALERHRDAERKIDLYRDALLPKGRQSLEVTQEAYSAGKADFLDVIEAQRILLEFSLAYEQAVTDRALWLADAERLVGTGIDEDLNSPESLLRGDEIEFEDGNGVETGAVEETGAGDEDGTDSSHQN